ncbi:MAG: hypothetical protein IPH61_10530 [Bacteroidetes bacterium]|nr:hypothetical protein [Bacteroidota bacterium]
MKRLTTLILFLIISSNGFCDTLDYWHVYINDKVVAKFNENSKDLTINIKKTELKVNDIITVRYGNDHPCINCFYGLTVIGDFKRKEPGAETKEHFGKLSIQFKDLLDIQRTDGINRFSFNYYERTNNENHNSGRLLFVLTIS